MLVAVPDELPWRTAVLAEPLAVALSVVRDVRAGDPSVLAVVGGGTIGQLVAVAARALIPRARLVHVVRHAFQAVPSPDAVVAVPDGVTPVAALLGARAVAGPTGPLLLDGPDVVVDAVGTPDALGLALRLARRGGRVATVGNPAAGTDLHPLWLKRLTLTGQLEYRTDPSAPRGEERDPFREAVRLLCAQPGLGPALVTHESPLDDAAAAVDVARHRREHHAIKVALVP
jgi:threonine dehydrogenase-like Zn-dependent dehydrogenase